MPNITCLTCKQQFPRNSRGTPRTYCDLCQPPSKKPRPQVKKNCRLCETEFYGVASRFYCTPECRISAKRSDREQRWREVRDAMDIATEKHCKKCDRTQPKELFRKDRSRPDGLHPYCIECWRKYTGCKPQRPSPWGSKAEYNKWHRENKADHYKDTWYDRYLYARYRISEADYYEMLERQGGKCAICGTTDAGHSRGRSNGRFRVDHDHSCCPGRTACGNCVRGLLCNACNAGLGFLRDDIQVLEAAMDYLKNKGINGLGSEEV